METIILAEKRNEMFLINVTNMHWLEGVDETEDLCLHGHVCVQIGNELLEYDTTVSATALYLLKTLTEDHRAGEGLQMLPCCGSFLVPNEDLSSVEIIGCSNGIDFTVLHEGNAVTLITESGNTVHVAVEDYRKTVLAFARTISDFYGASRRKTLPPDEFERNGYIALMNEWNRRVKC